MARPARHKHYVTAAREEALLACDLYNQRRRARNIEAFFVHMCIAWTNLLQAVFERDGVDYYYRKKNGRYDRVDGEKKSWDLTKSVSHYFPQEKDPIRQNILFFVGLRNKIEHRLDPKQQAALAELVAGKAQALIRNFETILVKEFKAKESLCDQLHFPLFLSSLTEDAVSAIKSIRKSIPKGVVSFIDDFDNRNGDEVAGHASYDFRVLLIPALGKKNNADMAIQFVNIDSLDEADRNKFENAVYMIRDRPFHVLDTDLMRVKTVVNRIKISVPQFNPNTHADAWRVFKVRPGAEANDKSKTELKYCSFNKEYGEYLYTEAWVEKLLKELGKKPIDVIAQWRASAKAATAARIVKQRAARKT